MKHLFFQIVTLHDDLKPPRPGGEPFLLKYSQLWRVQEQERTCKYIGQEGIEQMEE